MTGGASPPAAPSPAAARLLAGYRPPPGVADELIGGDGRPRAAPLALIEALAAMPEAERTARIARGVRHLHEAGVHYRRYGEGTGGVERPWPLAPLPVILTAAEWSGIEAALMQRADLLEQVMADLHGPARLVQDGHLPPALVARNAEWWRPLVGVRPRSGHFLHFIAFDIARSPDGGWFVLSDRTQAPSGAGFALENRTATARIFPELFQRAGVRRLAGFFAEFGAALAGLGDGEGAAILTPGPLNDTYFEHAYLARHLGLPLVEGEDLTVRGSRVMLRSVAGLRPVGALWRRLDAGFADPLELDPRSALGTPGMVSALRAGTVEMVNALGAGLLETRGFLAFLPRICMALRGEPLQMPNIATWWCGQPSERAFVAANADRLTLGAALGNRLPLDLDPDQAAAQRAAAGPVAGMTAGMAAGRPDAALPADGAPAGLDSSDQAGGALVGQEAVRLSTAPVWADGRLVARAISLRVFLARGPGGWIVMPGGYARIGPGPDSGAIALQGGGSVADVWVLGAPGANAEPKAAPAAPTDTAPAPARPATAQPGPAGNLAPGAAPDTAVPAIWRSPLPSRAADNFFWLGRYGERAEALVRALRAYHLRLAEGGMAVSPLLKALATHLHGQRIDAQEGWHAAPASMLDSARGCAARLRDRLSGDTVQALGDLCAEAAAIDPGLPAGADAATALGGLLRRVAGLSGLVHENMHRSTGWRFLTMGRALERADAMAAAMAALHPDTAPEGAGDLLLELGDSVIIHRRRYPPTAGSRAVVHLMALDPDNPRAVLYQFNTLRAQAARLPGQSADPPLEPLLRELLLLHTRLATARPDEVDPDCLSALRAGLARASDLLGERYLA